MRNGFLNLQSQLSPDGRWLAYSSDESGRFEISVQPFPLAASPARAGRVTVSADGGTDPRWRSDGAELFYLSSEGKLMSVSVGSADGSELALGSPRTLFDVPELITGQTEGAFRYDVSSDGKRFLVLMDADGVAPPPLTVVLNWQAEAAK